jgi:hypothetical protein
MRQDVAGGILDPVYYIMKKYGVDEETARTQLLAEYRRTPVDA